MQNWLKRSLLVLSVFGVCWIGAIWYWRSTTRMPETGDLALAMLAMPLLVLSMVWLGNKAYAARSSDATQASSAAPAQEAQDGAASHDAAPGAAANAPWLPLGVTGAALRMPHGDAPAELASAIAEGEARLDLDPELTDMQGFPIMAGRVAEIDLEPLQEWLSGQPATRVKPHQLRALALGGEVAGQLAIDAAASGDDGVLQLLPLLPEDWPAALQEVATGWLAHCAAEAGWPRERLTVRHLQPGAPASVPGALRDLAAQAVSASAPAFSMLLACDSAIDADAVEQLAINGKLYGQRNPNGRMPAEGAAGVLLQPAPAREALRLLALAHGAPDQPAPPLAQLAQQAMEQAQAVLAQAAPAAPGAPLAIDYISADTDHRVAAVADLMQCVEARAPGLDTNTALACVGAACGHTGAAGALAALALALQQASDNEGHALCLANGNPRQPFALLVGPLPAPAAAPASSAPTLS
ncbi:hypothetical protein [Pseudoduganella sp.]|uniref:hypothetical protein n=1 Tax=Pseudoduganella sp. TaxID=1880898 RepID=UPI0035B4DD1C